MKFDINEINNENNFEVLLNFAKQKNLIGYINKFAISSLNLSKLKNFIIACLEEKNKATKLVSKPYKIVIDPTNACNLGCALCPTGLGASARKKKILDLNVFKKIIDEIKNECIELHLYNWGEPTLNKNLLQMLNYCNEKNIWTKISTNFSIRFKENYLEDLIKSGLNLLHVDIDGLDQKTYETYRKKGNINLVLENLQEVKKIKKKLKKYSPIVEVAMLAMKQNEHQHEKFLSLKDHFGAQEIRVDKIQYNPNMEKKWLPKNKNLIYRTYEGGLASSTAGFDDEIKQCHWPWSGIVINADGSINPCCIIDDPNSDFGSISKKSVYESWNSDEYISSRAEFGDKSKILKNTICNICKNQTHSKRLNRVSSSFAIKL